MAICPVFIVKVAYRVYIEMEKRGKIVAHNGTGREEGVSEKGQGMVRR